VQTGPDSRFVYAVGEDRKVAQAPVKLAYVEQGFAVVDGLYICSRVVTEGAQNLRPGATVTEAERSAPPAGGEAGQGGKGKGKGKGKGGGKKGPDA
jgi:hypothetical protein